MSTKSKKILLLSASIGTGHTKAAMALQEYWEKNYIDRDVTLVDFLSTETFSIDNLVRETYIKTIDVFPMLYDVVYRLSQGTYQGGIMPALASWFLKRRMQRLVEKEDPDAMVFTHPFPCGAACLLKRKKQLDIPLFAVITDFTVHKFWLYEQVDGYCVGSLPMVNELKKAGIDERKIHLTGIPIQQAFYEPPIRDYSKAKETVALIMGGGLGLSAIQKALEYLDKLERIHRFIVVAGNNTGLYESLLEHKDKLSRPVTIYGYTNRIPELMKEASILITKPGALTCTEAITMGLPIVCFDAIPGHEEANASFLEREGAARWARDIHNLADVVDVILGNPSRLQDMSNAGLRLRTEGAANIDKVLRQYG